MSSRILPAARKQVILVTDAGDMIGPYEVVRIEHSEINANTSEVAVVVRSLS